jgi:hypothetical protein
MALFASMRISSIFECTFTRERLIYPQGEKRKGSRISKGKYSRNIFFRLSPWLYILYRKALLYSFDVIAMALYFFSCFFLFLNVLTSIYHATVTFLLRDHGMLHAGDGFNRFFLFFFCHLQQSVKSQRVV